MSLLDKLTKPEAYTSQFSYSDLELQKNAQQLCWELKQAPPCDEITTKKILSKLFGTFNEQLFVASNFHCDYGFNIHFHGMAFINYNCTILDTSPVNIGANVCIGPGVCISCAGHAIDPEERSQGITTSAPITIEDNVWIGANVTICAGVRIGKDTVIGAGSVVTKNIPAGVIALGSPCKVIRAITEKDRINNTLNKKE